MRTRLGTLAIAIAVACVPLAALGEGESLSRVDALETRLMALEDQLASSQATIDAQREILRGTQAAGGALGAPAPNFWDDVSVGGFMSASYLYNFNDPDTFRQTQETYSFHRNQNTFSLDAVKFDISKPAPTPGSVGFEFDVLFGQNVEILAGNSGENSEDHVYFQQAYILYNWSQSMWKLGKFETILGYEVIDGVDNNHITHSAQFTFAIPLMHTGVMVSYPFSENLSLVGGAVNSWDQTQETDFNDNKGILYGFNWAGDNASLNLGAYWGNEGLRDSTRRNLGCVGPPYVPGEGNPQNTVGNTECAGDNHDNYTHVWNLNGDYNVTDAFGLWASSTYGRSELSSRVTTFLDGGSAPDNSDDTVTWYALGGGMTWDLSERMALALRGEWFHDEDNYRFGFSNGTFGDTGDYYEGTATLRYMVTPNFMMRAEYRRDWFDGGKSSDRVFLGDDNRNGTNAGYESGQDVVVVEASLLFE